MSNGEHGAVSKLGPDGGLDQVVGLEVDGGGGLVEHQHSGPPQQRSHLVLVVAQLTRLSSTSTFIDQRNVAKLCATKVSPSRSTASGPLKGCHRPQPPRGQDLQEVAWRPHQGGRDQVLARVHCPSER